MRGKGSAGSHDCLLSWRRLPNEREFSSSGLQGPQWGRPRLNLGCLSLIPGLPAAQDRASIPRLSALHNLRMSLFSHAGVRFKINKTFEALSLVDMNFDNNPCTKGYDFTLLI